MHISVKEIRKKKQLKIPIRFQGYDIFVRDKNVFEITLNSTFHIQFSFCLLFEIYWKFQFEIYISYDYDDSRRKVTYKTNAHILNLILFFLFSHIFCVLFCELATFYYVLNMNWKWSNKSMNNAMSIIRLRALYSLYIVISFLMVIKTIEQLMLHA